MFNIPLQQIICARYAAAKLGSIDCHLIYLKPINSNANMAPAQGVPKTAANPALTPIIMMIFFSESFSLNHLANGAAIAPPICTAVPSRPAEPPAKWVNIVPMYTKGAILKGID